MTQVIIYNQDNGTVSVIHPSPEALEKYGIQAIAIKDVPAGKKFAIVDASEIPTDRSARNAWVIEEESLTDGVGGEEDTFPEETQEEQQP